MHIAAAWDSANVMNVLIRAGAKLNLENDELYTPLHVAVRSDSADALTQLLEANANVNTRSLRGETPMLHAVRHANAAIVELLIANDANIHVRDAYENTLLHEAMYTPMISRLSLQRHNEFEGPNVIVRLLCDAGVDVDAKNQWGRTAVCSAAERGLEDIVRILVNEYEADESLILERYGCTAVNLAARRHPRKGDEKNESEEEDKSVGPPSPTLAVFGVYSDDSLSQDNIEVMQVEGSRKVTPEWSLDLWKYLPWK